MEEKLIIVIKSLLVSLHYFFLSKILASEMAFAELMHRFLVLDDSFELVCLSESVCFKLLQPHYSFKIML